MDTQLFIDTQWLGTFSDWRSVRNNCSNRYTINNCSNRYTINNFWLYDNWPNENVLIPFPKSLDDVFREHVEKTMRCEEYLQQRAHLRQIELATFKRRMKTNLMDMRTPRIGNALREGYKVVQFRLRMLSAYHPKNPAVGDVQYDVIIDLLNDIKRYDQTLTFRLLESFSNLSTCSDCGDVYHVDDGGYSATADGAICQSCQDNSYYSECMNGYINCDDAHSVYNSVRAAERGDADDYCIRHYGDRTFVEYDGMYFRDEDTCHEYRCAHDEDYYEDGHDDEYDSDEDNEPYVPGLRDYHCTRRNFVEDSRGPFPPIGVELEVYAPDRRAAVRALREIYSEEQLILERDGSLNCDRGFEIITMPLGLTGWHELAPKLLDTLNSQGVVGFNEPAGENYGIHVSIHRRFLTPLAEARIAMFLVAHENHDFVKAVAQRNSIYASGGDLNLGKIRSPKVLSICTHLNKQQYKGRWVSKPVPLSRYSPLNFHDNLAEFRIFQSTINPSSFMKNLEFVWALQRWTLAEAGTGRSINHRDFIKWLVSPQHRNDFPNLMTFLSKKQFFGTNYQGISSSWRELMLKPVETDAVEPMAA